MLRKKTLLTRLVTFQFSFPTPESIQKTNVQINNAHAMTRHSGCGRSLCLGDAIGNWKDRDPAVSYCGVSTTLPRTSKTHLLLACVMILEPIHCYI
ncbi:hypothetical protein E4T50_10638 [Aureobasidium sp. EXF-12298]|nr:hypothetical protein E4T50_10638 [Aureobasidium sp. EXF-12298]KAI4773905.1 hypothetical protein E4T52_11145 [Aureobasidium sp. EXF-3400]